MRQTHKNERKNEMTKLNKYQQKAINTAKKWLEKGYTPEVVASGIWNHYGYNASAKDGKVQLYAKGDGHNFQLFAEI